jgi:hypothetical protein
MTGDLFTTRFADGIFDEDHFPALGGEMYHKYQCRETDWNAKSMSFSNPHTQETKQ